MIFWYYHSKFFQKTKLHRIYNSSSGLFTPRMLSTLNSSRMASAFPDSLQHYQQRHRIALSRFSFSGMDSFTFVIFLMRTKFSRRRIASRIIITRCGCFFNFLMAWEIIIKKMSRSPTARIRSTKDGRHFFLNPRCSVLASSSNLIQIPPSKSLFW